LLFAFSLFFAINYSSKILYQKDRDFSPRLCESSSGVVIPLAMENCFARNCKNQDAGMRRLRESVAFRAVASIALAGFDLDLDSY
jgi:hypothetical protein